MIRLLLKNGMTLALPDHMKSSEISKSPLLKGLIDNTSENSQRSPRNKHKTKKSRATFIRHEDCFS
jgi:hypothetical protein